MDKSGRNGMNEINIDTIEQDRQSGSNAITQNALEYLKNRLNEELENSTELDQIFDDLQSNVKRLLKKHIHMASLRKITNTFFLHFKRILNSDKDRSEILNLAIAKIEQLESDILKNAKKIAQVGSRIIANSNKIMTISNSSMVKELFLTANAQKRKFEVFCLKSHPPDEGLEFAYSLANEGIETTIIADSEMGIFMPDVNLVLVGADRIYEDGFINKSGTLPLCAVAGYFNVPVYLVAETQKILLEVEKSIRFNSEDSSEIFQSKSKNISVRNVYFEKIPLDFIHKVICEEGVFEAHEFKKWYLEG
ncbi:MAG: hypothetical protein EH224_08150 [Calditrichaeota bacterium]|nr:MAG: hypothetical protein EH224_08150 [Calditrichota bacterium]